MKSVTTIAIACVLVCCIVAVQAEQPPVSLRLSASEYSFSSLDAPIILYLTFTNTSTTDVAICTNRIDCQNTVMPIVNKSGTKAFVTNEWRALQTYIADYFYLDEEQYILLRPGQMFTATNEYFNGGHGPGLAHLLRCAGPGKPFLDDGKYMLRVHYWGEAWPRGKAPPEIEGKVLKSRLVSNEVEIELRTAKEFQQPGTGNGRPAGARP